MSGSATNTHAATHALRAIAADVHVESPPPVKPGVGALYAHNPQNSEHPGTPQIGVFWVWGVPGDLGVLPEGMPVLPIDRVLETLGAFVKEATPSLLFAAGGWLSCA